MLRLSTAALLVALAALGGGLAYMSYSNVQRQGDLEAASEFSNEFGAATGTLFVAHLLGHRHCPPGPRATGAAGGTSAPCVCHAHAPVQVCSQTSFPLALGRFGSSPTRSAFTAHCLALQNTHEYVDHGAAAAAVGPCRFHRATNTHITCVRVRARG